MERICRETGKRFEVSTQDLDFYRKFSPSFGDITCPIPPPTLCPEARMRRRLCFRNERTLYRRVCDLSGKELISTYSPEAPLPVIETSLWYSDSWEAKDYGRAYDPTKSFFAQFAELMREVPMYALSQRFGSENSPFTNLVSGNKNCHYIFAASNNEDCFYSTYIQRCRDVADSFFIFDSELCYECLDCYHCYRVFYSQECEQCSESEFLIGCTGCSNCFGCISLSKQSYCLFNQPYSKAEYHSAVSEIKARPDSHAYIETQLSKLLKSTARKYYAGTNCESCTGDHLANCNSAEHCYDCTRLEDCKYCTWLHAAKDCYDCYAWGLSGEIGLENHLVGNNFYNVMFSDECSNDVSNLLYCRGCYSKCENLFGCIGLKKSSYCVLNRQYTKAEYNQLVPEIIRQMTKDGEWGEFFPQWMSPYCYNESLASEYFPLQESEVKAYGWRWREQSLPGQYNSEVTSWNTIDTRPGFFDESACSHTFACRLSGKNFRFTKQEIALYIKLGVGLPTLCFDERYKLRFNKRNPRTLWDRNCASCAEAIKSSYAPDRSEIIYCEKCFRSSLTD